MGRKFQQLVVEGYDPSLYKQAYKKAVQAAKHPLSRGEQLAVKQYVRGMYQADMKRMLKAVNHGAVDVRDDRTITSLMRFSSPSLFTDGVYPDGERVGATAMSMWKAYWRDAFTHYLEVGSPRDGELIPVKPAVAPPMPVDGPQLTDKQWNHVLYGSIIRDGSDFDYSGGHMFGYGWVAGRPQFPKNWNEDRIENELIATLQAEPSLVKKNGDSIYVRHIDNLNLVAVVNAKNKILSFYPEEW